MIGSFFPGRQCHLRRQSPGLRPGLRGPVMLQRKEIMTLRSNSSAVREGAKRLRSL